MNLDFRLIRLAIRARTGLIITVAASSLGGIATIWFAYLLSQVVAKVFLEGQSLEFVMPLMWLLLLSGILRSIATLMSVGFSGRAAVSIKENLRLALIRHLQKLGPAFSAGEKSGELYSVVNQGIDTLEPYFSQYLPQLVLAALIPISMLLVIFPTDFLSAIILLVTAPLIIIFMVLIGKNSEKLTRHQWLSLSRMSSFFLDTIQGLTTLQALNQNMKRVSQVAEISEKFRQTTIKVLEITFLSALVLELVSTISTALVAVEIGLRLLYGHLEFSQAFFILVMAPEFYLPLRMLGTRFHAGMSGVTTAKRIFEILDTPAGSLETEHVLSSIELVKRGLFMQAGNISGREYALRPPFGIKFERVSFSYPQRTYQALESVDLEFHSGQTTALVGTSGSGKSTIFQLLMKFNSPNAGKIRVGDTDLENIPAELWRSQIAWVPQKPYLFNETIRFNLTMGLENLNETQIHNAAEFVHLADLIESLPEKYETRLGERGTRFSSGQAQRLAIARSFLKNAPIILLDEPASHLDLQEDQYLTEILAKLTGSYMVILIGHHLSTIKKADQIIVVENGKVVEAGSHANLIEMNGCYTRMIALALEGK